MGNEEQPWFHIEAVDFLFKNLKESHVGFEFGSGSSTFWFSKFTKKITSVESDPIWYSKVLEKVGESGIQNIEIFLSPCKMLKIWELDSELTNEYEIYSDKILEESKNFDYISIDGVARSLCIEKSIEKLNPGGYLIIDNAERPAYQGSIQKIPSEWEVFEFSNSVDKTLIYRKNEKSDNNFGIQ